MASGVKVSEEVKKIFTQMKLVRSDDDEDERIRLVSLVIDEEIKVEHIYRQKDVAGEDDVYKFMQNLLRKDECRYYLYDCHFDTKESNNKEELVFVLWAPEEAKIASRMSYACSKSAMNNILDGVKHIRQINDSADCEKECFADALGKDVIRLEGHPVRGGGGHHKHDDGHCKGKGH